MFDVLFEYPLIQYQQADWFFASGWSLSSLIIVVALVSLAIVVSIALRDLSVMRRMMLGCLQVLSAAVLLVMLWQPSLRSKTVVPGDNAVTVVIDTSRSMHHPEPEGSRLAQVSAALQETDLLENLAKDFQVDLRSVADQLEPLDLNNLPPPGSSSRLKTALLETLDGGSQSVLSGVVLLTDGADTSNVDSSWWQRLTAAGIPVFPVGVGQETLPEDIALQSISVRNAATPDTRINARVVVRHGAGGTVRLRINDGDSLVYSADLQLPENVPESSHAIEFNSGPVGIRDLLFQLEPNANEINTANNSQRRILTVKDSKKRILYIEGEPRWEFKFIRRAVNESAELEVVSLLQTSPNKFYRQGVKDADELAEGFPLDQKSLFDYDAIIIGSFEAAKLNGQQQQHLRDFVRVRGGALLMIAGPRGLAEGGWARTAVAQALPVSLTDAVNPDGETYTRQRVKVRLTALGEETDWLRFASNNSENQQLWSELPELADVQLPGTLKAGASALLEATVNDLRVPLLVRQRYGRGKSFVLATSGTWRWQMGLPAEDQRHEKFWQGLLGELVAGSLTPMTITTDRAVYYDESVVTLTIDSRDQQFQPDLAAKFSVSLEGEKIETIPNSVAAESNDVDAAVVAAVDGIQVLPSTTPGRYQAKVAVPDSGEYSIVVSQLNDKAEPQEQWFIREDNRIEDFALAKDSTFLTKLANESGGQYLELDELQQLPDLLLQSQALLVKDEILPLWHVPAAFLLLFFLKLIEWLLRLRWNRI